MKRQHRGQQERDPHTPAPPMSSEPTPPWEFERPITSRRTARLTFNVFGRTYDELNRRAGEEVERITGGDFAGWAVEIDAQAAQKMSGEIIHYSAEVTASRTS